MEGVEDMDKRCIIEPTVHRPMVRVGRQDDRNHKENQMTQPGEQYATGIPKPPGKSCEDCAVFHKYNQGEACLIYCMGWTPFTHVFKWGNNPKRATMKGRRCRIINSGGKGSIEIEFENGQQEIVSWMSVGKIK